MKRVALLLCITPFAFADQITIPNPLTNNTVADAEDIQSKFEILAVESNQQDTRIEALESQIRLDEFSNLSIGNGLQLVAPTDAPDILGKSNIAIGQDALLNTSTGGRNLALGHFALRENISGLYNVAVGSGSQYRNSNGYGNVGVGWETLQQNQTGSFNSALGMSALDQNLAGSNTAVGFWAARWGRYGSRNVAIGYTALSIMEGSENVAIGAGALGSATQVGASIAGNGIVAIGYEAEFSGSVGETEIFNSTALGYGAKISDSNTIQLGNNSVTNIYLGRRHGEVGNGDANLHLQGKLTSGTVTYPNSHGDIAGQVLGTNGAGELTWLYVEDIANDPNVVSMQQRIESLELRLKSQKEELLATVRSQQEQMMLQQEQIAQLQRMVEHQFAAR